jgi:hypothetical protein
MMDAHVIIFLPCTLIARLPTLTNAAAAAAAAAAGDDEDNDDDAIV